MPKVIVTDLDGTLFYPKKRFKLLDNKTVKFIRNFIDEGNYFVVASGRNYLDIKKLEKRINRPISFLGCNSAFLYEKNKLIYEKTLTYEDACMLIEEAKKHFWASIFAYLGDDGKVTFYTNKVKFLFRIIYPTIWFFQFRYHPKFRIVTKKTFYNKLKNVKIYKLMFFQGIFFKGITQASIMTRYFRKYFPEYEFNWSSLACEINPGGCTKSSGIVEFINYHKLDKEDVYVVGDSGNDVSMFNEFYENSFCMEHSNSSIKKYAKHIISKFIDIKDFINNKE